MATRRCDGCTACCTILGVEQSLDKPPYTKCEFERGGCTIYHRRPAPCRAWSCLWLRTNGQESNLPDEMRPDKCGVVLDLTFDGHQVEAAMFAENQDAWRSESTLERLKAIAKEIPVVLHYNGGFYNFDSDGDITQII